MTATPTFDDAARRKARYEEAVAQFVDADGAITPDVLLQRYDDIADDLRPFLSAQVSLQGKLVIPPAPETPLPMSMGRYEILGEIAAGGMGVILHGRDRLLGRDVALKLLHMRFNGRNDLMQRFREEAQIGSQLQHPGIVPVHDIGMMPDGRPFFTMKMVKGQTLRKLLDEHPLPGREMGRFLDIFHAICRTVAYAHSKGVLHRDLKPLNIMVGAFGEVQVMDWGLGKVLTSPEAIAAMETATGSVVETDRQSQPEAATSADTVLGTFAYMPPEQAQKQLERVKAHSDVFGLGAILCEMLTGKPPYDGQTRVAVQLQATNADLEPAYQRLDRCGADRELSALAKKCLAAEPEQRFAHAGQVADTIAAYQEGVRSRLHKAELKQARRKWQLIALSVLLVAGVVGVITWQGIEQWRQARRLKTTQEVNVARGKIEQLLEDAKKAEAGNDLIKAGSLLDKARDEGRAAFKIAGGGEAERDSVVALNDVRKSAKDEHERVTAILAQRDNIERLRQDLAQAATAAGARYVEFRPDYGPAAVAYKEAFSRFGMDILAGKAESVAKKLSALPEQARQQVVAALDHWALIQRVPQAHLQQIVSLLDKDEWRQRFRAALLNRRTQDLRELARTASMKLPPTNLWLLGQALNDLNATSEAVDLLRRASVQYPNHFMIYLELGNCLADGPSPQLTEAAACYQTARALSPKSSIAWSNLALAKFRLGRQREAEICFKKAQEIQPDNMFAQINEGFARSYAGDTKGLIKVLREMIKKYPTEATPRALLGCVLMFSEPLSGAEARALITQAYKEESYNPLCQFAQAALHFGDGKTREGAFLARHLYKNHKGLSYAIIIHLIALAITGDVVELEAEARSILASRQGNIPPAEESFIHTMLGISLMWQGKLKEAEAPLREGVRMGEANEVAREQLAAWLIRTGKFKEAQAELKKTREQGASGLIWLRVGVGVLNAGWMQGAAEDLEAMEKERKEPSALNRGQIPEVALIKNRPFTSFIIYGKLFENPIGKALMSARTTAWDGGVLYLTHRFNAARAGVRAGNGEGEDVLRKPTAEERVEARKDALNWLKGELKAQQGYAKSGSYYAGSRVFVTFLQNSPEFASVRGDELKKLTEEEQKAWLAFWQELREFHDLLIRQLQSTGED